MTHHRRCAVPIFWILTILATTVAAATDPQVDSVEGDVTGAEATGTAATEPTPGVRGPDDLAAVEAFLDTLAEDWMTGSHVPGMVVSFVRGDGSGFSKGWGFADVEAGRPMDPADTVVRFGAGVQVTVPLALFQLRDDGAVDFASDVDSYLALFQLGDDGGAVTLHDLLVHTGGIDEIFMNVTTPNLAERPSMAEQLAEQTPSRFMPAGILRTHSPHGYAMAAHAVETVSGTPFPRHVKQRLFDPLAMADTDFQMTDELLSRLAVGYVFGQPEPVPMPVIYSAIEPELLTTADDMARFVRALLGGGTLDGERIASPEDVDQMLTAQFRHHPDLPGPTYGFFERPILDQVVITNSGARSGHTCQVILHPEDDWGLFFCANAMNYMLVEDFDARFMAEFYPSAGPWREPTAVDDTESLDGAYLGHFRHTRYPHATIDKMPSLLSGFIREVEVVRHAEGGYEILGDRYVETAPLVLERAAPAGRMIVPTHDGTIGFGRDENGVIDRMFVGSAALTRIPGWQTTAGLNRIVQRFVVGFAVILVLLPLIHLGLRLAGRRPGRPTVLALWVGTGVAALASLLLWGLDHYLEGGPRLFSFRLPAIVDALLYLPIVTTLGTVVMVVLSIRSWRDPAWNAAARIGYGLVVLFALAFLPFLLFWNIVPRF